MSRTMTPEQLAEIRKSWGWTQHGMANQLGMSRRAYIDLEAGKAAIREIHVLALERLSLAHAALMKDRRFLLPNVVVDVALLPDS